jgi:hypothetical protein
MPNHILTLCHTTVITDFDTDIVPAAIIKNNDTKPTPATSIHQHQPHLQHRCTQAQHCTAHIHLINLAITKALMPMIDIKPIITYSSHGYIVATRTLIKNTYGISWPKASPTRVNSLNFINAIVDNITGNVLKYWYLMKSDKHRPIRQHSFSNELGCLFQGICNIKGTNTCFFIAKDICLATNVQPVVAFVATIALRKTNPIAHALQSAATGSLMPATLACPQQTSSQPNCSSTPPSPLPMPNSDSTASTLPIFNS